MIISQKGSVNLKAFFMRYRHAWILLYFLIYLPWFLALEKAVTTNYTPVKMGLDDLIPFNELFVIPYYLWFAFIFVVVAYFFLTSKTDYYKCCAFLFIGMTICLIIYTIWPNGQNLRPDLDALGRNNILIDIMRKLYATDTSTNVCPSIHVFNSIGVQIAIFHSDALKKHKWIQYATLVLTILICLSTVFLKQHSAFDGICAILLAAVLYVVVYVPDYSKVFHKVRQTNVYSNE